MVSFMTGEPRASRIREIFGILQEEEPGPDPDTRIELGREALELMTQEERSSDAGGWLEFEIGKAFVRHQGPDPHQDLGMAIVAFTAALAVWTPQRQPVNWVAAQTNLGSAYSDRHALTGEHADEQAALAAYSAGLEAADRSGDPAAWAELQNSLGVLYLQRGGGDRAQTVEAAIGCLRDAAAIRAQLPVPAPWAETQVNLATAYRERVAGGRSENLEQSLACLDAALSALGDDPDAVRSGRIHLERSETLRFRIEGSWAVNLEQAYVSAQTATRLIQPRQDLVAWADAQRELAAVLRLRPGGHRGENLEAAITCYRQALAVYGRDTMPLKWALASHDLGRALIERRRGQRMTDTEEALEHLRGAVAVLGEAARAGPLQAAVLASLGEVYLSRRRGDRAGNAEAAWRHLSQAHELAERLGLPPLTQAAVLNSLGNAAMARIAEDHGQHVEDAIACYERALELAGRLERGQLQARLLNNLAAAYAQRERGDQAANVARALDLYEQVTSFRTREVAPLEWAETRGNIGTVLARHPDPAEPDRWPRAARAYADALAVLRTDGRAAAVITVGRNLGLLGILQQHWPDAVEGYQAALEAAETLYRGSLLLEARYDELTETAGLRAELAIALARLARHPGGDQAGGPQAGGLLRRAVTVVDDGRVRMLGDLMEQDREQLRRLEAGQRDLHRAYVTASERLRVHESEQWRAFQPL
jgi:tetratricopeptide (TPR) repeat protein